MHLKRISNAFQTKTPLKHLKKEVFLTDFKLASNALQTRFNCILSKNALEMLLWWTTFHMDGTDYSPRESGLRFFLALRSWHEERYFFL